MKPFLSIVIPAYNVENYLPACLDSVLKQDDGRVEVLIVDDGSKDSTMAIAEQYSKANPQIHAFQKENGYRCGGIRYHSKNSTRLCAYGAGLYRSA